MPVSLPALEAFTAIILKIQEMKEFGSKSLSAFCPSDFQFDQ